MAEVHAEQSQKKFSPTYQEIRAEILSDPDYDPIEYGSRHWLSESQQLIDKENAAKAAKGISRW